MNHPAKHPIRQLLFSALVVLALCGPRLRAEPIRVASWNLESPANTDTNSTWETRINSVATALRELEPDVVLLQGVPDWKTAGKIAALIDARFGVRICSAYADEQTKERSARQMAVLSRYQGTMTWHEAWHGVTGETDLGYAFALLDVEAARVGFASVRLPDNTSTNLTADRMLAAGQLFAKLAEIRSWKDNAPSALFLGGTLGADDEASDAVLKRAREEGFTSAFLNLPYDERFTLRGADGQPDKAVDFIYADGGGYTAPAKRQLDAGFDHSIVAVDWDARRSMPLIMVSEQVVIVKTEPVPAPPPSTEPVQASIELFGVDLKWWVLGLGGAVFLLIALMLRRPAQQIFDPARALPSSSGGKILYLSDSEGSPGEHPREPILTEAERRNVRPHLLRWLKEAFVGGLVRQRREMIETQDEATRQADELGRRMEQIQERLIERIHKAERRVEELEHELAEAKSENRELIESNLHLAQRELAEARARVASGGRAG